MFRNLVSESSLINSEGYNPDMQILEIQFKNNGRIYQYYGIQPSIYHDFKRSASPGNYLKTFIEQYYAYKEIEYAPDD